MLLDTCVLIWLSSEPEKLTEAASTAITENADRLYLSAISAWEIGIGVAKKRLELSMPPEAWFAQVVAKYKIQVVDMSWQIAVASTQLPSHHADPSDRLIIATAINRGLNIVTPDEQMRRHSNAKIIW